VTHGTSSAAIITSASTEWVLLSVIYHYVLARSPSPESAKISISEAWEKGQLRLRAELREHEARPGLILRPGEQAPGVQPECRTDQSILASQKFDSWDWERSYATWINRTTKSFFEYVNIEGNRGDVLKLWPETNIAAQTFARANAVAAKPVEVSAFVWAVVLTLDEIERETPNQFFGSTQDQLIEKVRAHLSRSVSRRTVQKALAVRRKRDGRQ
jgi:hypothetical protein